MKINTSSVRRLRVRANVPSFNVPSSFQGSTIQTQFPRTNARYIVFGIGRNLLCWYDSPYASSVAFVVVY